MNRKHFSWLLLVTFLVGAAVLLIPQQTAKDSVPGTGLLLPGMEESVNDIEWLQLTAAGNQVVATLQRQGDVWVMQEAAGYRADWNRLRNLLSSLAQAQVVEPKTSNPEFYGRLGVEDVDAESAAGVMISFSSGSGLPAVILGNEARGRTGQYVRLADSAESALIDTLLDVPADRSEWLETEIIDITDAEVVEVRITHSEGEVVHAVKASADDENFQLQDIPVGREIKSEWSVNALGNVLAGLEFDETAAQDSLDWEGASNLYLLTADGLLVEAAMLEIPAMDDNLESEFWIKLEAQLYTTALENESEKEADNADTRERAVAINERTRGWAYRIPQYKFNSMTVKMGDLLKDNSDTQQTGR